jgi:hypothetical protein
MIQDIATAWLYAYSSDASTQARAVHTVFVARGETNGREVLAQTSLSYLTTLSGFGAGAWVRSYTPPFGPPAEFFDFKHNSLYAPNAIAITFALNARAAEAYALGTIFFL